ncbi:fimbrillin family protein [uncultured Bacteroides sp.]|uniref:fimbrillin family protein n=1 Tax=uncultured Bacteroides sp. TaxID=162156 RepID=UPI002615DC49|nr:fimbrillin family protein [uncultured Bacteroides sp.]
MRKSFVIAAVILAVQSLSSCSENETVWEGDSHGQIVAHIEQPATTRTAVGNAVDGTNAVGIVWTDGDEIGVFDASGASQKCYAKVGQGTAATAAFAASGTTAFNKPVYAYYPYNEANASKDMHSLVGELPSEQNMDDGALHGDYKIGSATTSTGEGSYEFEFKHLFSMARITIDAADTPLKGETLKSLTMSVSRGETAVSIAGNFTFNAETGSWTQADEGKNSITLTWNTNSPSLEQAFTCYMSLFPVIHSGDLFTITVSTENYKAEFTANSLTSFSAEQIYTFPVVLNKYETIKVYDKDENVVQGKFTCAALNVDGLPSIINSGGPGSDGTEALGNIMNGLGYDFIAVSEDFTYHDELAGAMSNYNMGTYRGSVSNAFGKNDTDGLGFFWKKDGITAAGETMVAFDEAYGGLTGGANELIDKGFRHYVVTVAEGVTVDVYITHMNTFGDGGNTEDDPWVHAQLSQLRQLRDYVVARAKENNRPAIIMGDTNMRYTRHQIVDNLITPVTSEGLQIVDPWVEFHRNGVYPTWNTKSLMIRSKYAGDVDNDILCADDQRGEVVDKMWYINVPGAAIQLKATSCMNDVEHFAKSTEQVSFSGVTIEDINGNILSGQDVSYTKVNGYADHFPVVVSFEYTNASGN